MTRFYFHAVGPRHTEGNRNEQKKKTTFSTFMRKITIEERANKKGGIGRGRISSLATVLRLLSFPRTLYGDIQQQQQ